MKKISFILIITVAIVAPSCKKDLNQVPISTQATVTFYGQPNDFIQAVNAAYNSLRGYPERQLFLSEVRSDNIYPTNDVARDPDPINNFASGIAPNVYVEEGWNGNFSGIFRANTAIEQITKNPGAVGSVALATRLTAEARFLRAFFYFDLVKLYGKVPVVDHTVSAAEAITIARSPIADVYALIIADLQFAIANLPVNFTGAFPSYSAADVGRATKYVAEAVLAKVYMARSGPTYSIEGPGMGLNEWNLALPLLQDIITNGGFVFNTKVYSFPDPTPNTGIFAYANKSPVTNKEAVFDIMYLPGQTPILGAIFPWQLSPQNYFNSLNSNTPANGALGTPSVSNDLISRYSTTAPVDTRKAPFFHTTPYTYTGVTETKPFFRKYLDTTQVPASRFEWNVNFIAIRYTDVLMLKAECILHGAPGTPADVDAIVNQVRARAGQPAIAAVTLAQLFDERRKEFAGEGLRWFDLQRSGNLVTIMNAWKAVEDAVLKKMNPIIENFIIYPVPQTQLDAAPGLYIQNPGY